MAIWQYHFYVLPKEVLDVNIDLNKLVVDGMFDDSIVWNLYPTKIGVFNNLNSILMKGNSWSTDVIIYGDLDSTVFEFIVRQEMIQSCSLRINFSDDYEQILWKLIDFCVEKQLIFVDEDFDLVNMNIPSINLLIQGSEQYRTYHALKSK